MEVSSPKPITLPMFPDLESSIAFRMATSSTPGGSIPNFLAQASIPGQIAHDVPLFLKWAHADREYVKNGAETLFGTTTEPTPVAAASQPEAPAPAA